MPSASWAKWIPKCHFLLSELRWGPVARWREWSQRAPSSWLGWSRATCLLPSRLCLTPCGVGPHTSCLLGVRQKEPFYWQEKVRYTFQSSLWGLRAKAGISKKLPLAQENVKSIKKEESGSFQGQSHEKVGDADMLKASSPLPAPHLVGFWRDPAPLTKQKAVSPSLWRLKLPKLALDTWSWVGLEEWPGVTGMCLRPKLLGYEKKYQ